MFEVVSKRTILDKKGNDKPLVEKFLVDNCVTWGEAETKMLTYYNCENEIIGMKQSKIMEFVNNRSNDDQNIYLATIESVFINENGEEEEKTMKYVVGLFAESIDEAFKLTKEYMLQGISDLNLVKVSKSKIVDIIK